MTEKFEYACSLKEKQKLERRKARALVKIYQWAGDIHFTEKNKDLISFSFCCCFHINILF